MISDSATDMLRSIILCVALILAAVGVYVEPLSKLECSERPEIFVYLDRVENDNLYYGDITDESDEEGLSLQVTAIWKHVVNEGVPIMLIIVICAKLFYETLFLYVEMDDFQNLKIQLRRLVQILAFILCVTIIIALGVINDHNNYQSVTFAPPLQGRYAPV